MDPKIAPLSPSSPFPMIYTQNPRYTVLRGIKVGVELRRNKVEFVLFEAAEATYLSTNETPIEPIEAVVKESGGCESQEQEDRSFERCPTLPI
ncbi:unnamed protein product [Lactuca virosa]|uniref:Uncharacterized protein n=1 Tax=Lactuca virosa TaxID=75947 RepID=A0AAU9P3N7_9ASTR|nr:unnamed protein product [Lactuca virosa]